MKRLFISFLTIVLAGCSSSQEQNTSTDSCFTLKLEDGTDRIFNLCFGEYTTLFYTKNGDFENEFVYFTKNGKLKEIKNFSDGVLNGNKKTYWPNGQLNKCIDFKNGLEEGIAISYDSLGRELQYSILKEDVAYYYEESHYDSLNENINFVLMVTPYITYDNRLPCEKCPVKIELLLRDKIPVERYLLKYNIAKKKTATQTTGTHILRKKLFALRKILFNISSMTEQVII